MMRGTTTAQQRTRDVTDPPLIDFVHRDEAYTGVGVNGRLWHIHVVRSGWHLEFRDPGDARSTYAGTHASLLAAQGEASRAPGRPRQRRRPAPRR
jgi:hypothetical protein